VRASADAELKRLQAGDRTDPARTGSGRIAQCLIAGSRGVACEREDSRLATGLFASYIPRRAAVIVLLPFGQLRAMLREVAQQADQVRSVQVRAAVFRGEEDRPTWSRSGSAHTSCWAKPRWP